MFGEAHGGGIRVERLEREKGGTPAAINATNAAMVMLVFPSGFYLREVDGLLVDEDRQERKREMN